MLTLSFSAALQSLKLSSPCRHRGNNATEYSRVLYQHPGEAKGQYCITSMHTSFHETTHYFPHALTVLLKILHRGTVNNNSITNILHHTHLNQDKSADGASRGVVKRPTNTGTAEGVTTECCHWIIEQTNKKNKFSLVIIWSKQERINTRTHPVHRTHSKSIISTSEGSAGATRALISSFMASATSRHSPITRTPSSTMVARLGRAPLGGMAGETEGTPDSISAEVSRPTGCPSVDKEGEGVVDSDPTTFERACFSDTVMFLSSS